MEPLKILFFAGLLLLLVGHLWLLGQARGEGLGWRLACTFVPFAVLVFIAKHWDDARKPFAVWGLGVLLVLPYGATHPRECAETILSRVGGGRFLVAGSHGLFSHPAGPGGEAESEEPAPGKPPADAPAAAPGGAPPGAVVVVTSRDGAATPARPGRPVSTSFEKELAATVQAERAEAERLRADLARQTAALQALYRDLGRQRARLAPGDPAGRAAYDQQATRYTQLLGQAQALRASLAAAESRLAVTAGR